MPATFPGPGHRYDVAIVGAGGAGCEAAYRLAATGFDVLLVTTSLDTVFAAPTGRVLADAPTGTLAAEVLPSMSTAADGTVGSWELHGAAKQRLEALEGVHLLQSNVEALVLEGRTGDGPTGEGGTHDGGTAEDGAPDGATVVGVETWEGVPRRARAVALCVGSFLRARLTVGAAEERAGRPGEMAYDELADDLERRGVALVAADDRGGGGGAPPWSLRFARIADDELSGTRIVRLPGLYAAGRCVLGACTYERAALAGRDLADEIAADLHGPA